MHINRYVLLLVLYRTIIIRYFGMRLVFFSTAGIPILINGELKSIYRALHFFRLIQNLHKHFYSLNIGHNTFNLRRDTGNIRSVSSIIILH